MTIKLLLERKQANDGEDTLDDIETRVLDGDIG